ncbi:lipocalin family protein [Lysobacter sp. A6]|uniref:Lipocalin family protein n=1 Tax=Noviluteimonas lactosilytica TaxID=2888523 RepID=A0ABS8JEX3_9GAMM|nr:lipocalin family protein [Lysobacter lactosilyticus]MCC8362150.1 lipocalin family protein [Lysobacter lactosilyticus]
MNARHSLAAASLLALALIAGCSSEPAIAPDAPVGTWIEPIPGLPGEVQGFTLRDDGTAESINTATLQHERWRLEGDALVLTGKSLGNGATLDFEERYTMALDPERMRLVDAGGQVREYTRQDDAGDGR